MKLNTGKIGFPIEFDTGDKDIIYFNPNDPDLAVRMQDFMPNLQKKIKEFPDVALDESGKPVEGADIEAYRKLEQSVLDEIDRAFNGDVSRVVFKHCSPLAIVDGEHFAVQFLRAITPEIEKEIRKAREEISKQAEKHIGKYR